MEEQKTMAMTPEMCAAECHKSAATIYKLIKTNRLPHIRLGRTYLISRKQFENWLAGQSSNTPATGPTGTATNS
jgi:excisionase family DNA binding protein